MFTENDQTLPTREMLEKESSELRVLLLHLDGMLVHQRDPYNLAEPIYAPAWRDALWEYSISSKNNLNFYM